MKVFCLLILVVLSISMPRGTNKDGFFVCQHDCSGRTVDVEISSENFPPEMTKNLDFSKGDIRSSCIQHLIGSVPRTISSYFDVRQQKSVEQVSDNYKIIVDKIENKASQLLSELCKKLSPKKTCAQKCMDTITPKKVQKCQKIFHQGKQVKRCSVSKVKGLCRLNCVQGFKNCHGKECKQVSCNNGMMVNSCQDKCTKDLMKCKQNCQWENINKCWMERLPGNYTEECKQVIESEPFKSCATGCMQDIKTPTCLNQCKNIQVPKRMEKCWYRISDMKADQKCSFKKFQEKCTSDCKTTQCFNFCGVYKNGEEKCFKHCYKGDKCMYHCQARAQAKCYTERLPYQELKDQCKDLANFNSVDRCFKHCFVPEQIQVVEEKVEYEVKDQIQEYIQHELEDIKVHLETSHVEIEKQVVERDACCQRVDSCCQREIVCESTGEKYSDILRKLERRTRKLLRRQEHREETRRLFKRTRQLQRRVFGRLEKELNKK